MGTNGKVRSDDRAALLQPLLKGQSAHEANGLLPDVADLAEAFPTLNAMLCVNEVGGKPRQTATVTFWVEEWGVKGVLSDRATKRKLWAVSTSVMGLMGEFDSHLSSPQPDWRNEAGTRSRKS